MTLSPTDDDLKTLPPEVQPWVRFAKVAVKIIAAAALAIGPAITAYHSAAGDAATAAAAAAAKAAQGTQATKNKAEAGYQVTRQAMEALEKRVTDLESVRAKKGRKPAMAPKPKALPPDLDKAERQVYRGGVQAPGASPDAGRPNDR